MSRKTTEYLIDASNLHLGGGVQVAASTVNELAGMHLAGQLDPGLADSLVCLVSSEVAGNLESSTWDCGLHILACNSRPGRWAKFPLSHPRAILTVFGPYYRPRRAPREIVGFALPLLIYSPTAVGLPRPGVVDQVLDRLRWRFFTAADSIVTETADSAARVAERLPGIEMTVIPNCVSRAISDPGLWHRNGKVEGFDSDALLLASVGRMYDHKNLPFLGRLGPALSKRLGRRVQFVVTLTADEYRQMGPIFQQSCINVGIVTQRELGHLYRACAATVIPSLLEVSSATPMESMALGVPAFVADLPAMRSTYGPAAGYFNPWDAREASEAIAAQLTPDKLAMLAERGRLWAAKLPQPRQRAEAMVRLLVGDSPTS